MHRLERWCDQRTCGHRCICHLATQRGSSGIPGHGSAACSAGNGNRKHLFGACFEGVRSEVECAWER